MDGIVKPYSLSQTFSQSGSSYTSPASLNYTQVLNIIGKDKYNLSPRNQICGVSVGLDVVYSFNSELSSELPTRMNIYSPFPASIDYTKKLCLSLIDTVREKEISVGK